MEIGVSSYSYSQIIRSGEIKESEVPALAAKTGFDVVEFSSLNVPDGEDTIDYAKRLREKCDEAGVRVASYTIGADLLQGCDGNMEAEVERLKGEVRIAKTLGAPRMRHDATRGFPPKHKGARGFKDALPALIKGCQAVTEFAAELEIETMVENHGFFCQDSERLEMLVNGVEHPNFGILVDIGNFMCADENPGQAVGRLMPYAIHVHAKDFHFKHGNGPDPGEGWLNTRGGNYLRGAIIGHGNVPVVQCLRLLKKAGYNGVLSIEFEGMEDPTKGIELSFKNLCRFVAEVCE